jgi:hypothetical protein
VREEPTVTTVKIDPSTDPRDPRLPGSADTVVVFSDLNCSFAHLAVHRLHETRKRLGLEGRIWFDHRCFPLELFNDNVNERPGADSEVSVVGALDPEAGWQLWQGPDWEYPVTMLPPLEAVQAVKEQGCACQRAAGPCPAPWVLGSGEVHLDAT